MDINKLRFSASYASKYHNCHGSANLTEAIPGFEVKRSERAKSRDQGTALHAVMDDVIKSGADLRTAALILRELAGVFGKGRANLIRDQKAYIIWLFQLGHVTIPLEHAHVRHLLYKLPAKETGEMVEESTPPKLIRFLATALELIADIMEDGGIIVTEAEREASWMVSKPKTTVDILIRQADTLWVIDLKAGTIPVAAVGNEQLLYYARTFWEGEKMFKLLIIQDGNMEVWQILPKYLEDWTIAIQSSEKAILDGDLSLNAGPWCGFCPANPRSRGDKGYPFCPVQIELLYGPGDEAASDEAVATDADW